MAKTDNLHSGHEARHKFTREDSIKGGKASAEKARQKKDLNRAINDWLNSVVSKDKKTGEDLTGTDLMVQVAIREMYAGNPKFWELLRDTAGQRPVEKVMVAEVEQSIIDEVEAAMQEYEDNEDNSN